MKTAAPKPSPALRTGTARAPAARAALPVDLALREFWLDVSTQGACLGHRPGQGSAGFSPIDLFVTATAVRSGQSAVTAAWTPT